MKERTICLNLYKNRFCVIWKLNSKTSLVDAVVEKEISSRYQETQLNDIIKQVIDYKFPIPFELNCLFGVFDFDLRTCNVDYSEYCEAYAVGVYHLNNLYECFSGDLNKEEIAVERSKVHIFDRRNGKPVLKKIVFCYKKF